MKSATNSLEDLSLFFMKLSIFNCLGVLNIHRYILRICNNIFIASYVLIFIQDLNKICAIQSEKHLFNVYIIDLTKAFE